MSLAIRPFTAADLPAAARLLAAQHRIRRRSHPALPARFESDRDAHALLATLWHTAGATGVLATADGDATAYLIGLPARGTTRAGFVPAGGCARATDVPPETVSSLYDDLARRWVARHICEHHLVIDAGDPGRTGWQRRGFRECLTLALGSTPLPTRTPAKHIRFAGSADLDTVVELIAALRAGREDDGLAGVPPPDASAERAWQAEMLADPRSGCWLATDDAGHVVGLVTIRPPGTAVSPLDRPDDAVLLTDAVIRAAARGRGTGSTLVRQALGWSHLIGYGQCLLHWQPGNLAGVRFWQRLGFRPLAHHLVRSA